MSKLMISVSGIRGVVGESLTPEVVMKYAAAFGTLMGPGKVVVGSDTRVTGPMVKHAVIAGLQSVGCSVVDVGICPTPTVQMATEKVGECGGIIITASHNPVQWNALKLLSREGLFLTAEVGNRVNELVASQNFNYVGWEKIGKYETYAHAIADHEQAVLSLPYLNLPAIQKQHYKVVVDCVNGAGAVMLPAFLRKFGCEVVELNCTPDGIFPHTPEPVPENLTQLCDRVKAVSADIGFAVDPDSDRLAIVSDAGAPLGEEYTLALAINFLLGKKSGPVVLNASTSLASEDVAKKHGVPVVRTKVGEIHVAQKMGEIKAAIGGEGNGGVILPDIHLGRDAIVGIALILQTLTEFGGTISELKATLPQYTIVKKKIELGQADPNQILTKLLQNHRAEPVDQIDGLKFLKPQAWVQVRASNTEPIIRIMAEATSQAAADDLAEKFIQEIKSLI